MKKLKSKGVIITLVLFVIGAFLSAIVTAFTEDMIGDANLFESFIIVCKVIWSWLVIVFGFLWSIMKAWLFALILGFILGWIFCLKYKVLVENKGGRGPSIRNTYSDLGAIADTLEQMARYADEGFTNSVYGPNNTHDETSDAWYVERETRFELLMERLREIGIELPTRFKRLPRNAYHKDAVSQYSRLAALLRHKRMDKARKEFPR